MEGGVSEEITLCQANKMMQKQKCYITMAFHCHRPTPGRVDRLII